MKDFPSCFGENAVQVADFPSTSKIPQNLVTCVHQCRFHGKTCWITVTWSKNLMGQGLTVGIDNSTHQSLCKMEIKPWLFSKKKGSKCLESDDSFRIDISWDLSSAKFGYGPEPLEGFYLAIAFEKQMVLLLGDMKKEALKKTGAIPAPCGAVFVLKREHIFGKKVFATKVRFSSDSRGHDLVIECDTAASEPCLAVVMDGKQILQVKRLRWKFRGNHVVLVDDVAVEVFWDVYDWLFGGSSSGNAVFMFKTRESAEKLWRSQSLCDPHSLQWSWSQRFRDVQLQSLGFSLILHAWKSE